MLWERLRHASTAHTLQQKNLRRFRRLPAAAWERTSRISSARIYSSFPKRATGCCGFRATQTAVPQRQHQGNTPRALPCPSTPLPVQPGRRQDGHHGVIEQRRSLNGRPPVLVVQTGHGQTDHLGLGERVRSCGAVGGPRLPHRCKTGAPPHQCREVFGDVHRCRWHPGHAGIARPRPRTDATAPSRPFGSHPTGWPRRHRHGEDLRHRLRAEVEQGKLPRRNGLRHGLDLRVSGSKMSD